jgi:site-specific recombinase XerD
MKHTDFAKSLSDFLSTYLVSECGYSMNTVKAYATTFSLFVVFFSEIKKKKINSIILDDITKPVILYFLEWLEKVKRNNVSTRNARLAALKSFFQYLEYRNIKDIAKWQELVNIKTKRDNKNKSISFLSEEEIMILLAEPGINSKKTIRDTTLLSLMYDTGCRVQELCDFIPSSIKFGETSTIKIIGKGRRVRVVPLSDKCVNLLKSYMDRVDLFASYANKYPLFSGPNNHKLSRNTINALINKYVISAKKKHSALFLQHVTPHSFRHSRAMHLLDAGVDLIWIKDFLGHSSIQTTEIYAKLSEKKKREALERVSGDIYPEKMAPWQTDSDLLNMLNSYKK